MLFLFNKENENLEFQISKIASFNRILNLMTPRLAHLRPSGSKISKILDLKIPSLRPL